MSKHKKKERKNNPKSIIFDDRTLGLIKDIGKKAFAIGELQMPLNLSAVVRYCVEETYLNLFHRKGA